MSPSLISRSDDLTRLRDEGFEIEVWEGNLIVHHIPYVNNKSEVQLGKFITELTLDNDITMRPNTHVMNFMGEFPCHKNGREIKGIQHGCPNQVLREDIVMNFSFSAKPKEGYADYYEKVTQYAAVISAPAEALDPTITAKTFTILESNEESVFQYMDTNASRASISGLSSKFYNQKIAVIGLGGTGSYVLDFISKTPVPAIHLFDDDTYHQHGAFRSPGAAHKDDFGRKKVERYADHYSNMHRFVFGHVVRITKENVHLLDGMTFVIICIDDNPSRKVIIDYLMEQGIPFVDTGIGVETVDDQLIGMVRITAGTKEKSDHFTRRIPFEENGDDEYDTNIQIAELNAFAAIQAVIKWKKLIGFYQDLEQEHHSLYNVNVSQLTCDETTT